MGRPISRLTIAVTVVVWAIVAGQSSAQMGYQACSLDWLVADSDVVVRASVSDVERDSMFVTLKVHETLKGDRVESLTFIERDLAYNRIYQGWKDAGREQLWFLVRKKQRLDGDDDKAEPEGIAARSRLEPYELGWWVIRLGPPIVPEERRYRWQTPPIFSMDLIVREKPNDILETARVAAAVGGKRGSVKGHEIDLPGGVMQRVGRSGDANSLLVPVDRRLEKLAHRLIQSPGDFLAGAERAYTDRLRLEGIRALRHFSSEKNVALLKPLLADPTWSIHVGPDEKEEKVYDLREAAYETLRSWGIDVDKPVLREAAPKP